VKLTVNRKQPRTVAVLVFVLVCFTSALAQRPAAIEQKPTTKAKETAGAQDKNRALPGQSEQNQS
jgi:hypothetical protein